MVQQRMLGMMFRNGNTGGKASNVEIEDFPDLGVTAVIGYGHAVYAVRDSDSGEITYYDGWRGYSMSTSCQLTRMKLAEMADETSDERKSRGDLRRGEKAVRRGEDAPEAACL